MGEKKYFVIDSVSYGPHEVAHMRADLIKSRDAALGPDVFEPATAVLLSHVIAILEVMAKEIWDVSLEELRKLDTKSIT